MLSRNETVSHIETHIELKLLPLQPMKLSWKCFIQNHWWTFPPQTSHHKSHQIQSYHLPMLPESNISASKVTPNFTEQMCCIFGFCWIELNLWSIKREPHEVWKPKVLHAFPTLKNTIRPKGCLICLGAEVCKAKYSMFEVLCSFEFPFNIQQGKGIAMDMALQSPKSQSASGPGPALIHRRLPRTMSPVCGNLSKVLRHRDEKIEKISAPTQSWNGVWKIIWK